MTTIFASSVPLPSILRAPPGRALLRCLVAVLVLSACAETPVQAPPKQPGPTPEATEPRPAGRYKVGTPYQINGLWYYPAVDYTYEETGIASWYGPDFHGKPTANGEIYDMNALTAAHRTLPMPSIVEVTNLENGRQLRLTINDRGPFAKGRIIDISRRGAQLLGFQRNGVAKVRVRIEADASRAVAEQMKNGALLSGEGSPITVDRLPVIRVDSRVLPAPGDDGSSSAPKDDDVGQTATVPPQSAATARREPVSLKQPEIVTTQPVAQSSIFIQAGAFSQFQNANRARAILSQVGNVMINGVLVDGRDLFRVRLGPVASVGEADRLLDQVVAIGYDDARIIVD